jgi:hypothetical protein
MEPVSGLPVDGKILTQKKLDASLKINPNYLLQIHFFATFCLKDRCSTLNHDLAATNSTGARG